MAGNDTPGVSLLAVREALEHLKNHVDKQFNTQLPKATYETYQKYERILRHFKSDPASYSIVFNMMKEILPNKRFERGSLGEKLMGCLNLDKVPADIRVCLPECRESLPAHDQTECRFDVWERGANGLQRLPLADLEVTKRAIFITQNRNGLQEQEKNELKQAGVREAKLVDYSDARGVAITAFEPLERAGTIAVVKKPENPTSNITAGQLFTLVLLVLLFSLVLWKGKKQTVEEY